MKKKKDHTDAPGELDPVEVSPDVFELLDAFTENLKPANLGASTKQYTTKEIIAAIKEFNDDLKIRDSVVVDYLKSHGFHYEVLPDQYSLKFQWLFAEK